MSTLLRIHLRRRLAGLLALACGVLLTNPGVAAPDPPAAKPARARVTGEATVTSAPTRVVVEIAAVTRHAQAGKAVEANAAQVEAVLTALRKAFGKRATLATTGYALNPVHTYREGVQHQEGYEVRSRLQVLLDDVAAAGRVIDVASAAGANEVSAVRFELADEGPARKQALREATRAARAKADDVAAALDLRVLRVVLVDEGGAAIPSPRHSGAGLARFAAEAAVPTPIEAGAVEVRASVVMEVELGR